MNLVNAGGGITFKGHSLSAVLIIQPE